MSDIDSQHHWEDEPFESRRHERRDGGERRQRSAHGFTCISIVGWICRREHTRRTDDPEPFADGDCFNPGGDM